MIRKHFICRKMFFRVLWPSLVSAMALAVANTADAVAVGNRMGESGLAAIGIVTPVYMIYNLLGYGFSTGGCVTHGRLTASGREEDALSHFKLLSLWLLGLSAVVAILGNVFLYPLLALLGVNGSRTELLRLCVLYARPLISACPLFLFDLLLYDVVRCDDDAALAAVGFTTGCIVDVALNLVFVLALGWGVSGSAWATVIAQTVSVLVLLTHFGKGRGVLGFRRIAAAPLRGRGEARRSLATGFSTSTRFVFQFLFLMLGNRLLIHAGDRGLIDGEIYVAVFDVVLNVSYLLYGLYQAFSDTMQPLATTFSVERDRDNLSFLLRLALGTGLAVGVLAAAAIAFAAGSVGRVFGLSGLSATIARRAIPSFCLSTPFAGMLIVLTGYYQSTNREKLAVTATLMRTAVFLLPATLAAGYFFPYEFWWLFLISDCGALAALGLVVLFVSRRRTEELPSFSAALYPDDREVSRVMAGVEAFCEEQEVPPRKAMSIQLAVEELTMVTMEKAFTGKPDEYLQINLSRRPDGDYVLHIRDSAAYFNPLDMRMGKINRESSESLLDSIGVMMVRKQAKELYYRNYSGFNVMTVIL